MNDFQPTPRKYRAVINAAKRARAAQLSGWYQDCKAAALARIDRDKKSALLLGDLGGGSGVTIEMRRLSGEAKARELETLAINEGPNHASRRAEALRERARDPRTGRADLTPARNTPYVNPARDLKPGRRLRLEEN